MGCQRRLSDLSLQRLIYLFNVYLELGRMFVKPSPNPNPNPSWLVAGCTHLRDLRGSEEPRQRVMLRRPPHRTCKGTGQGQGQGQG